MQILDFIELQYDKLSEQIKNWLQAKYSKSDINFSEASPFGQILKVDKELFTHNIIYNKNSVNQISIDYATDERMIDNIARISGHNPTRPISATGTLNLKLKTGVDISNQIGNSTIKINNRTLLKNKTNNLYYNIVFGTDYVIYNVTPNMSISVNIIQGKYESQTYTGTGYKDQSFSVNVDGIQNIENFNYAVFYNGLLLDGKDNLVDMLPDEFAFYSKTGFLGGVDIYFGTGDFGFVPAIGSTIEVRYLLSDGKDGNILNNKINDFQFIDSVYDGNGDILAMETLFDVFVENDINFGANKENKVFTKNLIPLVSRNFVLATPDQFIYQLSKLNMFSLINAYNTLDVNNINNDSYINQFVTDVFGQNVTNRDFIISELKTYFPNIYDNVIYLYLIPDVKNYFLSDYNYFTIPFDAFYLDQNEKTKVLDYLKMLGTISITTNVKIVDPVISRYVVNIYVRRYSTYFEDNIRNQIINLVSDYFINNNRFDRVVNSELIKLIKEQVPGVDSVNLDFVSKKNEDYHRDHNILSQNSNVTNTNDTTLLPPTVNNPNRYDPNLILGIDPVQGDIITEKNEYAVLRGGWYDRNGIYYNDVPILNGLSTINIVWTGVSVK
jgi:hypothetical protein